MSRRNVAVLGCGPAGLLAALAAAQSDCNVDIFSKIVKSRIGGAQYLYREIPALTSKKPDGICVVQKLGTKEGYAYKVYGDPHAETSWDQFGDGEELTIWNMQDAYEKLWSTFGGRILDTDINIGTLIGTGETSSLLDEYDHILVCIPKRTLCIHQQHTFAGQQVMIRQFNPGETDATPDHHWIQYDGTTGAGSPWYRASALFGYAGFEYPVEAGQSFAPAGAVTIEKPLWNDCDCWAMWPSVSFMGRYGSWTKGVLIHHAYEQTKELLA